MSLRHIRSLRVREWVHHHSQLSSVFTGFQLQSSGSLERRQVFPHVPLIVAACTTVWSYREDQGKLLIFPTPSKYTLATRICQLLFTLPYFQVIIFCIKSIFQNCFLKWKVGRLPSMVLVHDNWNPESLWQIYLWIWYQIRVNLAGWLTWITHLFP